MRRHPRESGGPLLVRKRVDSRFRGNDVIFESAPMGNRHATRKAPPFFRPWNRREASLLQALPWLFTATDSNCSAEGRGLFAISRRAKALSNAHRTT